MTGISFASVIKEPENFTTGTVLVTKGSHFEKFCL